MPLPISVADNTASAFLELVDAPALTRIVTAMLGAVGQPGRIVVSAAEPLAGDVRAVLASEKLEGVSVSAVSGTATRADCIRAALESLQQGPFSTSHVLVHDISSPLASADMTARVVAAMRDGGAIVIPALAVTDSVKTVDLAGMVTGTMDRSALRAVQFPRGFAVDVLAELLGRDTAADFDEIAAAVGATAHITVVDGDPDAFRVELPRDADFIEAIIASRSADLHGA